MAKNPGRIKTVELVLLDHTLLPLYPKENLCTRKALVLPVGSLTRNKLNVYGLSFLGVTQTKEV